jgi:SAM-dependent methyltransferase
MLKHETNRTEFYESAVSMGFYGNADGGLVGKKDNVRKYWEDIFIKLVCRPFVQNLLKVQNSIRVLDLGAGSGEGFEILTHIPPAHPVDTELKDFVLKPNDIEHYIGLDVSPAMIAQGRANYRGMRNISFEPCDLEAGLSSTIFKEKPFDIYFSIYGSLSHLTPDKAESLFTQIFKHSKKGSVLIFDVHAKYSAAWPKYWSETKDMLPYNMAYLMPAEYSKYQKPEWFNVCYWKPDKLKECINQAAKTAGAGVNILNLLDRSVFVGRHIDTGLLSTKALPIRYQVNRLLDHNYRGDVEKLEIDLSHLEEYKKINKEAWNRLTDYQTKWNRVIYLLEALMHHDDKKVSNFIENTDIELMSDDLKLLTWLFRNSDRFPVVDFWASIIGPQVAVILRNIEMSYSEGAGCGHGLVCVLEVLK